jgi:hypothetical protein
MVVGHFIVYKLFHKMTKGYSSLLELWGALVMTWLYSTQYRDRNQVQRHWKSLLLGHRWGRTAQLGRLLSSYLHYSTF